MFAHLRQPDFGRLRTTLLNGCADAVPLLELGIHPKIKAAIVGRPLDGVADEIAFMRSMGYDFTKLQPVYEFEKERQQRRTGAGKQRDAAGADRAWASEHEGIVRTWEEFERYDWPTRADVSYRNFETAARILPDGMKIIGQYGDIFTSTWEMMGFETFAAAMYEEPDLVDAILAKISDVVVGMFETMAQIECVGALWYSDDIAYTAGLMVSPEWLREKFFPHLRRIGDFAKARGLPFIYHTDGVLWEVFDDILACGVTAQHPIEPKAMDIVEVKDRVGDRLCLCGNVDVDILARGTPEDISALVRRRHEQLAHRGGWCLGSSNSVPDYAKLENYIAMVKTGLECGRG